MSGPTPGAIWRTAMRVALREAILAGEANPHREAIIQELNGRLVNNLTKADLRGLLRIAGIDDQEEAQGDQGDQGEAQGDQGEAQGDQGDQGEAQSDQGEAQGDQGEAQGDQGDQGEAQGDQGEAQGDQGDQGEAQGDQSDPGAGHGDGSDTYSLDDAPKASETLTDVTETISARQAPDAPKTGSQGLHGYRNVTMAMPRTIAGDPLRHVQAFNAALPGRAVLHGQISRLLVSPERVQVTHRETSLDDLGRTGLGVLARMLEEAMPEGAAC